MDNPKVDEREKSKSAKDYAWKTLRVIARFCLKELKVYGVRVEQAR